MIKFINLTSQFYQFQLNWTKTPKTPISSPRILKIPQSTKLIKLNHIDSLDKVSPRKPIILLRKKEPKINPKLPKWKLRKYPKKMHEKCMKLWKLMQREGQRCLTGLGRERLCKKFGEKRQKQQKSRWPVGRRQRVWKSLKKVKNFSWKSPF